MTQGLLGVLTLVGLVYGLRDWRTRIPWLLSVSLVLPASGTVPLPGFTLTPYFLVALVTAAVLAWQWARGRLPLTGWPGSVPLLGFIGWGALVTLAGPTLFNGIGVLNTAGGTGLVTSNTLSYSGSNVAQVFYFALTATVIVWFASPSMWGRVSPHVLLPGLLGCMSLSFLRLLHDKAGLPFPTSLVDSSNRVYIDDPGAYRLRGVFTEPSTLAHYSIASFALCAVMLFTTRGRVRWLYALLALLAGVNITFARSGTAVIGGAIVIAVTVVLVVARASRSSRGLMGISVTACFLVVVGLLARGVIGGYASGIFATKVDSASYDQRTYADGFALRLFLQTHGLGVGLGSNQPSSLWPMLLSCVGIVGSLLYAGFVLTVVVQSLSWRQGASAAIVVISLVTTKSVAGSFLSEPLLMLALALAAQSGAMAAADRRRRRAEETAAGLPRRAVTGPTDLVVAGP